MTYLVWVKSHEKKDEINLAKRVRIRHTHPMTKTNEAKKTKVNLSMFLTLEQVRLLGSLTYKLNESVTSEELEVVRKLRKAIGEYKFKSDYGTKTMKEARRIQSQNAVAWACNPNSETYLSS